jgi:hypothetical protein
MWHGRTRRSQNTFNSKTPSDVKIVCGNETFFCHKNILATSSDIFAAMCDKDDKGDVQVDDFEAKTIRIILAFFYGYKIVEKDGGIDLLLAADKYNIPGLVKRCELSIKPSLSKYNALETLVSTRLMSSNVIFNAAKEIIQQAGMGSCSLYYKTWNKLRVEQPQLVLELLEVCIVIEPPLAECDTTVKFLQEDYTLNPRVWDHNPRAYFQDMEKLFTSGKFSDVKIICGTETFLCHKYILASRSDVFAAMFNMTGSAESQKGVVQVDDFDAKTMKTLLEYIYGNSIDRKDGDMDLLLAADKYNLPGLVKCCELAIIADMSLNNALETFLSSEAWLSTISSKKHILATAKDIFMGEISYGIKSNHYWNTLKVEKPKVAMELLDECLENDYRYQTFDRTARKSGHLTNKRIK